MSIILQKERKIKIFQVYSPEILNPPPQKNVQKQKRNVLFFKVNYLEPTNNLLNVCY